MKKEINISDFYIDIMRDILEVSIREGKEYGAPLCKIDDEIIIDLNLLSEGDESGVDIPTRCTFKLY